MKNAKRMIVLSEEEYKKLKGCQQSKLYNKAIVYKQEMNRKFQKPRIKKIKIDGYFTPEKQSRVKSLLLELESIGVKIKVNREIQLPHGDTVDGSDIVPLMKELFIGTRLSVNKPIGWKEFLELVAQSNIPLSVISKTPARNIIQRIRSETMTWEEY